MRGGFNDWIEIFRGGAQTDARGRVHDGDALIHRAAESFDPHQYEPPLVVGHPRDNHPAFGWVRRLRKRFKNGVWVLEAKVDRVRPAFEAWVRRGLYKKRSAGFFPDGRLRHVGFLGAAPPAVDGLADIEFTAPAGPVFEGPTGGENKEEESMTVKELIHGLAAWLIARLETLTPKPEAPVEAKDRPDDMDRPDDKDLAAAVDRLVAAGQLPPAAVDAGLKEFLAHLDRAPGFEFKKDPEQPDQPAQPRNPAQWLLTLLELLAATGLFDEVAVKGKAAGDKPSEGEADDELGRQIAAKVSPRPAPAAG